MSGHLRVAVDATPLLGPLTGIGVFTRELLRHLPAAGVDPVAYATSWRGRDRLRSAAPPGTSIAARPQAARPLQELWRRVDWPPIEVWTPGVDVAHGTNFVVPPTRRAAPVVTVHDLTFVHHPEMSTAHTLRYPELIRRAVRRGAWVHVPSAFVGEEVVEVFDVPAERVVTVHHGIDGATAGDPERGAAIAGGSRYVLSIATAEPRKDLPLLVDAFDRLAARDPDLRLVLAGPDGWGADALADRIRRSPSADRIVRPGFVPDEDRAALLAGARVLAYPSRYEGFGLPPLEAMAAGTPVVATAVGAIPEVLGDAASLVPPADLDALVDALAALVDDEEERARRRALGAARVARYTWPAAAAGLARLYAAARAAHGS